MVCSVAGNVGNALSELNSHASRYKESGSVGNEVKLSFLHSSTRKVLAKAGIYVRVVSALHFKESSDLKYWAPSKLLIR